MQLLKEMIPEDIQTSLSKLQYNLSESARNPRICGVLDRTVLEGGKRLRPLLTFLMGDFFGLAHDHISPYAIDIERIHAATLAHDDVVDDAHLRRGKPSLNSLISNKKAILAGDYLLASVLQEVSQRGDSRIVNELARVIAELVEGEWLQIENRRNDKLTFADIERVALKKTGSVIRWCCVAPCILQNLPEPILHLTETFGESLGIAFQLGDDLLDYTRDDGGALADMESGVVSSVIFYLMSKNSDEVNADVLDFTQLPTEPGHIGPAIKRVRKHLDYHLNTASLALNEIQSSLGPKPTSGEPTIMALKGLLQYLSVRV